MDWPKRPLESPGLPHPKRLHTDNISHEQSELYPNFDLALSDEVVLSIFSYLSPLELCTAQSVNRFWARLSTDNQLWKSLFISKYPLQRLRGSRGFSYAPVLSQDERLIKPLPHRVVESRVLRKEWKWMFRISSNWENGRCLTTRINTDNHDVPASGLGLLLAGSSTIFSAGPRIYLHSPEAKPKLLHITPKYPSDLTALALDQSPPPPSLSARLAVFHRSGHFLIHGLSSSTSSAGHTTQKSCEIYHFSPSSDSPTNPRTANIVCAAYHHPLLVTLSAEFHLSIYLLPDRDSNDISTMPLRPQLRRTVQSYTSFAPSSLSLTRSSSTSTSPYKLLVTYAVPVYPSHWSVGASELLLVPHPSRSTSNYSTDIDIASSRNVSAVQNGWIPLSPTLSSAPSSDDEQLDIYPPRSKEALQWDRKVGSVAATQTDGKWIILAGDDNTMQVYRIYRPPAPSALSLTFVRTLYGHTAGIATLQIADGRCVSVGHDGSIWTWDLEADWEVQVNTSTSGQDNMRGPRSVVFDERRIVSAHGDGVDIRLFDL